MRKNKRNHRLPYEPTLRESVVDHLDLPKDLMLGDSILKIAGNREIYITNYLGILGYERESILLQAKHGRIHITGTYLVIASYSGDEMKIQGCVQTISFEM
jgi:sporulation protein YqfC